ncbi:MAG: glycine cleavage system protein GcvH [Flavobacteriaceae bacterium]|jgi:glycine cleavage system H protein|uniref:glycine cleavage system protein GcvH n=1 Tax=Chryseobacterium sp. RR2-3-20 TaxID=2787626 RepID=UPI001AE03013|nr:glycine cleavage system protein GcvH [Chryseobacterium sp. RR2-3-20]MDV3677103.1 glycine cleavage system protein H [Elizabethkingia anophelis]MDV3683890.1 glycine cleavage system protein H [Elizabethkingia anophelis]MDV3701266.1 glycine cleavage system protein H [Elizabethkingia anophelis]MDV3763185.1 glycine cleavage system protein H [Elizabethkingia anophelis]MDV3802975.1 glycine cleavage system protein H [Elizabethkingia anophelis]
MEFPNDLKYSKEHTWISVQGNTGTIGITEFAQSELGEIVYADLPNVGYSFQQDEVFGSVEAVKTVSDLFMPVSGKIIETNELLLKAPTLINDNPYKDGWLIKIEIKDITELENLLTSNQYKELTN